MPVFTHLEVHSHFTLLGGTAAVTELAARAAADGLSHLALSDTNALYGVVAFARACQAAGVQPIIGMTVAVAPLERQSVAGAAPANRPGHLVLLATGPAGYRSLCRLSSHIQGRPDREAVMARGVDWDTLKANTEGLICLSGGRMGWMERCLRQGDQRAAGRYAARLGGIYGENAYLALELHRPEDETIAREVATIGQKFGLAVAAVQPVYCLAAEDAPRLRLLAAIREGNGEKKKYSANGAEPIEEQWLMPEEVTARFARFPEALAGVEAIVARCEPALPDGRPIWPALQLPDGETAETTLTRQARTGLFTRFGPEPAAGARLRLERELTAITRQGYAPLFLVVADVVRFARQRQVPVSTRGSVANSLVAYCLGITTVDPIEHDLLFERFLNPARANPPDIDLDFCSRRRDEVLAYVRDTYGADRVALVGMMSTMGEKSVAKEVGKVSEKDQGRKTEDQKVESIDQTHGDVVFGPSSLVGQPHHLTIHPGGVVITPGPLTDFVPVQWRPKGFLVTQLDHESLEALGLPKLDLLGIRALTVLAEAADLIRRHFDPTFRLEEIPAEDELTAGWLGRAETIGVFQCESAGAQRTLRQLRARNLRDLAIAHAFFKPGPAMGGMARSFVRRYRGEEPVSYLHPALEPILARTKGILLFQEQVLRLATEIAGLTWEQADHLRRGMSKMRPEKMALMQSQFIAGCQRPAPVGPGLSPAQAQTLWEHIIAFGGYGFNQGHATAYADVSYRSAYVKAHWPAAFLCARLASWGGFHHPAIYIAEATRLGIPVRPPHVNASDYNFTLTIEASQHSALTPQHATLWMGLGQVRDLRHEAIATIITQRQQRPFDTLSDLLERVSLQSKEVTHLIQCGALDGLGPSRTAMLAEAGRGQRAGSTRQLAFTFAEPETPPETAADRLAWEMFVLGQPVSVHPLDTLEGSQGVGMQSDNGESVIPLRKLAESGGRPVTIEVARLPGWTGGPGFFVGDRETYMVARGDKSFKPPRPWQVVHLRGRWRQDEWGTGWFQLE